MKLPIQKRKWVILEWSNWHQFEGSLAEAKDRIPGSRIIPDFDREELHRLAEDWLDCEWGDKLDDDDYDKRRGALQDFIDDLFREDEPDR